MAYSQEDIDLIFNNILVEIENGRALRKILKEDDNMPSTQTFYKWIDEDEIKSKQYARATELRAEVKFESIESDYLEEPQRDAETGRIDSAWVQLQRLKIDAKKWELSKLNPKKYGDKTDITSGGEKITNVAPPIKVTIVKPTDEDDE
jgi:hypothetical protein